MILPSGPTILVMKLGVRWMPSLANTEYASAMSSTLVSDVPSVNDGTADSLVESMPSRPAMSMTRCAPSSPKWPGPSDINVRV